MHFEYDYLIVGAGLWGSVFAHEATQKGKRCLVIDKRNHAGGNIYCEDVNGINVHKYGAHIFHTNDKPIWDYVNRFADFNNYINSPLANFDGSLYNLPFNMNTFYQLWKVKTPAEAQEKIASQIGHLNIGEPRNLEEQALKLVGTDIYEKLIKGYTEKQWGKPCSELPAFIIKRLPVRFTFNNNYFNDRYQGIPVGGYNVITTKLLSGCKIVLNADFFADRDYWKTKARTIVYTGKVDQYFNFCYGELEYRSLAFEHRTIEDCSNFQGNAVVNYTNKEVPYTRIIEHKHFEFGTQGHTVITYEFSKQSTKNCEPYYPLNDDVNTRIYNRYKALKEKENAVIFGGRLAEYRYYDMHQIVASALKAAKTEFNSKI